jgi:hypothetical protein
MRRFFCENCGEEVKEDDDLCPRCGAIFAAIKCPRCGFRGKVHEFRRGCPSCGFLGEDRVRATSTAPEPDAGETPSPKTNPIRNTSFRAFLTAISGTGTSGTHPPGWLFWLIIIVMVGAFALLAMIYTSL